MKITPEQISNAFKQGMPQVILVSGDEPLLVQETVTAIRQAAIAHQFDERCVFDIDANFAWDKLAEQANSLSLFSARILVECRLPSAKPGITGSKAFLAWINQPPEDQCLLIVTGKLDSATQRAKWVTAVEKAGVFVPIWPIKAEQMPRWLKLRAAAQQLNIDAAGISLLCDKVAGNCLAAKQEIDKLQLLYGSGNITVEQIQAAVCDSSRYNVFELVDACLNRQAKQALNILQHLTQEGIETILILWALVRECRMLTDIKEQMQSGAHFDQCASKFNLWQTRKTGVQKALQHHTLPNLYRLLKEAQHIDAQIKGAAIGDPVQHLTRWVMDFSGHPISHEEMPCDN